MSAALEARLEPPEAQGEPRWLTEARRRATVAAARAKGARRIVEVGCGADLLALEALEKLPEIDRWVMVEPTAPFAEIGQRVCDVWDAATLVRGFFEASTQQVRWELGGGADLVILDGMLHELPYPDRMLEAALDVLAPDGWVHVSVPNAYSLHRRLGVRTGALDHAYALGAASMQTRRVYDRDGLVRELAAVGLEPAREGGYGLTPLPSANLRSAELDIEMQVGLARLGEDLPELAAEIYVDARRTTSGSSSA